MEVGTLEVAYGKRAGDNEGAGKRKGKRKGAGGGHKGAVRQDDQVGGGKVGGNLIVGDEVGKADMGVILNFILEIIKVLPVIGFIFEGGAHAAGKDEAEVLVGEAGKGVDQPIAAFVPANKAKKKEDKIGGFEFEDVSGGGTIGWILGSGGNGNKAYPGRGDKRAEPVF